MSDLKSKLPDLNEITTMATKLFKDVKSSVGEIIDTYKQKREFAESQTVHHTETKTTVTTEVKPEKSTTTKTTVSVEEDKPE